MIAFFTHFYGKFNRLRYNERCKSKRESVKDMNKNCKMLSLVVHTGFEGSDHCRVFFYVFM